VFTLGRFAGAVALLVRFICECWTLVRAKQIGAVLIHLHILEALHEFSAGQNTMSATHIQHVHLALYAFRFCVKVPMKSKLTILTLLA